MGIKGLLSLLKKYAPDSIQQRDIKYYNGHFIINDAIQQIYRFCIAIRNQGTDMVNSDGKVISHLYAVKTIIQSSLKNGIIPIFVFDGKNPSIKQDTMKTRRNRYNKAKNKLDECLKDDNNTEDKIKYYKKTFRPTVEMIDECKNFLTLSGIPWVQAPEEADSQCAAITLSPDTKSNTIISDDMDMLVFGSPYLLRDFNKNKKINEISLDKILSGLHLTYSQFVDVCILIGSDYCPTIKGIGNEMIYQRYLDIINKNHDIVYDGEKEFYNVYIFLKILETENNIYVKKGKHPKYSFSINYFTQYKVAKMYYMEKAIVKNEVNINYKNPNKFDIIRMMVNENGFDYSCINSYINILNKQYKFYCKQNNKEYCSNRYFLKKGVS